MGWLLLGQFVALAGSVAAEGLPYGPVEPPFGALVSKVHAAGKRRDYKSLVSLADNALEKRPPARVAAMFYTERCYAVQRLGDNKQAVADCSEAIRLLPGMKAALSYRASSYTALGQADQAVDDLTETLRLGYPYKADIYSRRAAAYEQLGKRSEARLDYEAVLRAPMKDGFDYIIRARTNSYLGKYKAAANDFAAARKRTSLDSNQLNAAAWFEATCPDVVFRNGKIAIRDATKALESAHSDPHVLDTVPCAYAETGDFAQAISYVERAIKVAGPSRRLADLLRGHLRLFQEKKPCRAEREF